MASTVSSLEQCRQEMCRKTMRPGGSLGVLLVLNRRAGMKMLHVLLVEDNQGDVLLVREAIRSSSLDADVLVAYDGEQALRFLSQFNFKPDIVLLDLNMPKFSGLQILEK